MGLRNIQEKLENPFCLNIYRLRLKQNRYPVLLLTQGVNTKYPEYADPRTWTIENGSNFVAVAEILGMMQSYIHQVL